MRSASIPNHDAPTFFPLLPQPAPIPRYLTAARLVASATLPDFRAIVSTPRRRATDCTNPSDSEQAR